ncbi:cysteine hydrolase family protein [Saccharibacter floricola]|uniref:Isochorismate hydrolase n=1 Tax=Saccharibacter floricola DSM 15669 TaxID=1123227 RepID=A0ABQ0NZR7_9PROT|nr:cysteine hydrolase family protein [Saccharibacter floricola]GBQ07459.1 isochorismate hydrolase [Saccharibacter floricola DSM 15669]
MTALLLIDIQNDYFPNGKFPLPEMIEIGLRCQNILNAARKNDLSVVHIQHIFPKGMGDFLCAGTQGSHIHECVAPLSNEIIITKEFPNSFHKTTLNKHLLKLGCKHVILVGAMTQMCIDATARAALDLGYQVTICDDAIAAQRVTLQGINLDTAQVNAAFLSALSMAQARVVPSTQLLHTESTSNAPS